MEPNPTKEDHTKLAFLWTESLPRFPSSYTFTVSCCSCIISSTTFFCASCATHAPAVKTQLLLQPDRAADNCINRMAKHMSVRHSGSNCSDDQIYSVILTSYHREPDRTSMSTHTGLCSSIPACMPGSPHLYGYVHTPAWATRRPVRAETRPRK